MSSVLKPVQIDGNGGTPPEPDWSSAYTDILDIAAAHEQWGVIVRAMQEAQTIAVENGDAVERLVNFRLLYRRAMRQVAEHGAVLKSKNVTRAARYSPHYGVMRQVAELIMALEAELGLAPVRRNKAGKAQKKTKVARAADNYLKAV